jgi:hypothetical protein
MEDFRFVCGGLLLVGLVLAAILAVPIAERVGRLAPFWCGACRRFSRRETDRRLVGTRTVDDVEWEDGCCDAPPEIGTKTVEVFDVDLTCARCGSVKTERQ